MLYDVIDSETDGLLDEVTKIHCLCIQYWDDMTFLGKRTITDYSEMRAYFKKDRLLVAHNIERYDIPVFEKILDITISNPRIDTLGLSWYLYSYRAKHGLASWGETFGVAKPEVDDWVDGDLSTYIHRCEEDVEINRILFQKQYSYLMAIYKDSPGGVERILGYLSFKIKCLRDQEAEGITVDTRLAEQTFHDLTFQVEEKREALRAAMPDSLGKVLRTRPKANRINKNGKLNYHWKGWLKLLESEGLPEDLEEYRDPPNPDSFPQLKDWLRSLGWIPETFKTNKKGEEVEQISLPHGEGICPSVKALYELEPDLVHMEGYFVIKHRLTVIKGILESIDSTGKVYSTAHGFTNTLRLTHSKPIVNLPKVGKEYGEEIRGCLTVPSDEYLMCGADISGLESACADHYIYYFDPEYVEKKRTPGYDPHTDLAVMGKLMKDVEAELFAAVKKHKAPPYPNLVLNEPYTGWVIDKVYAKYYELGSLRHVAKTTNFACTYGAGAAKIAKTANIPFAQAQALWNAYWELNKGIRMAADACKVIKVNGQKWLLNPVSGFYMYLKEDKDKFSTLNQSTGVYVFDTWVRRVREMLSRYDIRIAMQYHDEIMFCFHKSLRDTITAILQRAMDEANAELNLNVTISMEPAYGMNYADVH